jgi:hypothetical protein
MKSILAFLAILISAPATYAGEVTHITMPDVGVRIPFLAPFIIVQASFGLFALTGWISATENTSSG